MTETKTENVNYENELNDLTKNQDKQWFTPKSGTYKVKFESDGVPYDQEWEGEKIQKLRFDILVNQEEDMVSWGVSKGKTLKSLFGQLVLVANHVEPKGKLVGKTINLVVGQNAGKRSYTVVEALGLQPPKIKEVKV